MTWSYHPDREIRDQGNSDPKYYTVTQARLTRHWALDPAAGPAAAVNNNCLNILLSTSSAYDNAQKGSYKQISWHFLTDNAQHFNRGKHGDPYFCTETRTETRR